jgi:hypothetical protein
VSATDRVVWLDRGWQPVAVGLCPSEKAWDREIARLNGTQPWPDNANHGGHTLLGVNDVTGQATILVAIGQGAERDAMEVILTLVHEAVHVWQFICNHIGEKAPGIEMEAYAIEEITRGLIEAYSATQGKGKKWLID